MQDDNPLSYVTPQADNSLPTIGDVRFKRKLIAIAVILILGGIYYFCRWRNYWAQPLFNNVYAVDEYQKMPVGIYQWFPWPPAITDGRSHLLITDWRSNMAVVVTGAPDQYSQGWSFMADGMNAALLDVGRNSVRITRQPDSLISIDTAGITTVRHLNPGEAKAIYDGFDPSVWQRRMSHEQQDALELQLSATTQPATRP